MLSVTLNDENQKMQGTVVLLYKNIRYQYVIISIAFRIDRHKLTKVIIKIMLPKSLDIIRLTANLKKNYNSFKTKHVSASLLPS